MEAWATDHEDRTFPYLEGADVIPFLPIQPVRKEESEVKLWYIM